MVSVELEKFVALYLVSMFHLFQDSEERQRVELYNCRRMRENSSKGSSSASRKLELFAIHTLLCSSVKKEWKMNKRNNVNVIVNR